MSSLWVEKYRPKKVSDFIFKNTKQKEMIQQWIEQGYLPGHMLFSGIQGTGKTTLAKMCFYNFLENKHISKGDVLEINASQERGIDTMREKIMGFCQTYSFSGGLKYILLDEADYLTKDAQATLRNTLEKYHDVVRFVLTCNYPAKIIPALHSRLQQIEFADVDVELFFSRMSAILEEEGIQYDAGQLAQYIEACYPDMRKCINTLQQHSYTGELEEFSTEEGSATPDYVIEAADMVRSGRINEARKLITSQASAEEYPEIYRWMYRNLDLWGDNEETQGQAIVLIAKYLRNDAVVADQEINLAAAFVELSNLRNN